VLYIGYFGAAVLRIYGH